MSKTEKTEKNMERIELLKRAMENATTDSEEFSLYLEIKTLEDQL